MPAKPLSQSAFRLAMTLASVVYANRTLRGWSLDYYHVEKQCIASRRRAER